MRPCARSGSPSRSASRIRLNLRRVTPSFSNGLQGSMPPREWSPQHQRGVAQFVGKARGGGIRAEEGVVVRDGSAASGQAIEAGGGTGRAYCEGAYPKRRLPVFIRPHRTARMAAMDSRPGHAGRLGRRGASATADHHVVMQGIPSHVLDCRIYAFDGDCKDAGIFPSVGGRSRKWRAAGATLLRLTNAASAATWRLLSAVPASVAFAASCAVGADCRLQYSRGEWASSGTPSRRGRASRKS